MRLPWLVRLFGAAVTAWWNDNALRLGASLAYYTLFAIAPVLLVAIAIAGLAFGADAVRGELTGQLRELMGPEGAAAVQALLEGASRRQAGLFATVVGSVTFVLAATGAFLELQAVLNSIWRVTSEPALDPKGFLISRARSFGIVLAIGFLLLVSLAVSAALAALASWLGRIAPSLPWLWEGVNVGLSFAVSTALFALLFKTLPDVKLQWGHVGVGAAVTAALFTVGKQLIGFYLGRSSTASSYGAAGSVIVLLLWVYYSSQIVLLGAEFTRLYAEWTATVPPPEDFARPDPDAVVKAT